MQHIAQVWANTVPRTRYRDGLPQLLDEPEGSLAQFVRLAVHAVESDSRPSGEHWTLPSETPLSLHIADVLAHVQTSVTHAGHIAQVALIGPSRMRYRNALSILAGLPTMLQAGP